SHGVSALGRWPQATRVACTRQCWMKLPDAQAGNSPPAAPDRSRDSARVSCSFIELNRPNPTAVAAQIALKCRAQNRRGTRRHSRCVRKSRAKLIVLATTSRSRANVRKIDTRDFRRATRSTSRQVNRQILLNLVREHQPISRADLARRMTLGRGVVTTLVKQLLNEGALYEGALADLPRGRRPTMLYVETRDRLVVAIDVRFSRIDVLLSDFGGKQIALERFGTRFDPEQLLDELAIRVRRLLRTHAAEGRCEGIGMVIPGMVDRHSGRVRTHPHQRRRPALPVRIAGLPRGSHIQPGYGRPVPRPRAVSRDRARAAAAKRRHRGRRHRSRRRGR